MSNNSPIINSRYNICKETIITNLLYAKQKELQILIILFSDSARLYTNIKFSSSTNTKFEDIKTQINSNIFILDNLSYDDIIKYINDSQPNGSTNFLIPFNILNCIDEDDNKSEIFFLSDGYNDRPLNDELFSPILKYKHRITTMGIGSKSNFDSSLMTKMSKSDNTIEGENVDIIQQELLAQMSDAEVTLDSWKNVEIVVMGKKSNLRIGSMMQLSNITREEYDQTDYKSTTDNTNLNLFLGSNNNIMISKKDIMHEKQVEMKVNQMIFIVDQSGSMHTEINNQLETNYNSHSLLMPQYTPQESQSEEVVSVTYQEPIMLSADAVETNINTEDEYIKCIYNIPIMKSYQRIIFGMEILEFKGIITWTDNENNKQSITLSDMSKYNPIQDPHVKEAINLINIIGHYINLATISNKHDKIDYFRKINQICKTNRKFFDDVIQKKLLTDYSLIETLFYNRKQAINLFQSTISLSEKNMERLLNGTSSCGGYRMYSATATLSSVANQTPSCQPITQQSGSASPNNQTSGSSSYYENINRDISYCSICYDNLREFIFSCGHCYACKTCAEKLLSSNPMNKCSYCSQTVVWIRKIALSEDQRNSEHYYKCISKDCFNVASIVSKCDDLIDDTNYHLTYCLKCFKQNMNQCKKSRISRNCFCKKEITQIIKDVYFM
jgi:hypothetical protein